MSKSLLPSVAGRIADMASPRAEVRNPLEAQRDNLIRKLNDLSAKLNKGKDVSDLLERKREELCHVLDLMSQGRVNSPIFRSVARVQYTTQERRLNKMQGKPYTLDERNSMRVR